MTHSRGKNIIAIGALIAAAFLAYSNHFENSFHFDDSHAIIDNPYIRDLHNLGLFFKDTRTFSSLPANRVYRPIVTASLAVDYALAGGLKPVYFQISTFGWFLVQLLLMYALFRKIYDLALPDPRNTWVALITAGIYAVHPAVAETVNYVIQRGDVYSTLGVVAALTIYALFPRQRRYGWYLGVLALAILSKPPALIFPLILLVYIRLFEEDHFPASVKRCVPALLVAAGFGYLLSSMTPTAFAPGGVSAYAYRITQPLVALRYFRTFFAPNQLTADTDFSAINSIVERGAWLGFLFVAALIAAAFWCSRRVNLRPVAFGLWWFLLALVPTAIFPLAEVENDHRMYFPLVGLAIALVWPIALGFYQCQSHRYLKVATGVTSVAILCTSILATRQRNEVWRTDDSLWLDVTLKSPRNGRGLMNYGLTQMKKGDFRRALDYFERAALYTPAYATLEINRGIASGALGQNAAAEEHFRRAIALSPAASDGHYFYARWLKERNRSMEAIAQTELAIQCNEDYTPARYLMMELYSTAGDWDKLRAAANSTLQRFPGDATAAAFLTRSQSPPLATATAQTRSADDYVNLSLAYYQSGKYDDSIAAAEQALKLQPDYAAAYNNMAAAYAQMRMWDQAINAAHRALEIKPDFQLARNNLAWAESRKNANR